MRSSHYNIFVSLLVIFILKIDLRPYLCFMIFDFHCDLPGSMKAEDTGRTEEGRQ